MMLTIEIMHIYNKPASKCENCNEFQNLLEDSFVFHLLKENVKSIFYHMVDKILESNVFQLTYQVPNNKSDVCFGRFISILCFMQRIQACFKDNVIHIIGIPYFGTIIEKQTISLALCSNAIVLRIAKKTYNTSIVLSFN